MSLIIPSDLNETFSDLLSPSSDINWMLLTYLNGTNTLKLFSHGNGGLAELVEEFDEAKVMYGFARVLEETSRLQKLVLVSWCGEGVPSTNKAMYGFHVNELQSQFKGIHVHINARVEADIDVESIMKKVRDSSGSKYTSSVQLTTTEKPTEKLSFKIPKTDFPFSDQANRNTFNPYVKTTTSNAATTTVSVSNSLHNPKKNISARALYPYNAQAANELSFFESDLITNIQKVDVGWWYGSLGSNTGVFPANFVLEIFENQGPVEEMQRVSLIEKIVSNEYSKETHQSGQRGSVHEKLHSNSEYVPNYKKPNFDTFNHIEKVTNAPQKKIQHQNSNSYSGSFKGVDSVIKESKKGNNLVDRTLVSFTGSFKGVDNVIKESKEAKNTINRTLTPYTGTFKNDDKVVGKSNRTSTHSVHRTSLPYTGIFKGVDKVVQESNRTSTPLVHRTSLPHTGTFKDDDKVVGESNRTSTHSVHRTSLPYTGVFKGVDKVIEESNTNSINRSSLSYTKGVDAFIEESNKPITHSAHFTNSPFTGSFKGVDKVNEEPKKRDVNLKQCDDLGNVQLWTRHSTESTIKDEEIVRSKDTSETPRFDTKTYYFKEETEIQVQHQQENSYQQEIDKSEHLNREEHDQRLQDQYMQFNLQQEEDNPHLSSNSPQNTYLDTSPSHRLQSLNAIVLYDYLAQDETEITLNENERITGITKVDEGWWSGTNGRGEHGLFPANYVEVESFKNSRTEEESVPFSSPYPIEYNEATAAPNHYQITEANITTHYYENNPANTLPDQYKHSGESTKRATVLYDYEAVEDNEISLVEGEMISQIVEIDEGWWSGVDVRGGQGLFPANYVALQ